MAAGTAQHTKHLAPDEKGMETFHTPGGRQKLSVVSRPGLFKLIQRSNKPEAKAFDRWVRHEVLPQIMDTGGYVSELVPTMAQPAPPPRVRLTAGVSTTFHTRAALLLM